MKNQKKKSVVSFQHANITRVNFLNYKIIEHTDTLVHVTLTFSNA